jgi:FkbM family methyltransferase
VGGHYRRLLELAENGAVLWDIGMNIGAVSLLFANDHRVCQVYGYEPLRHTFDCAIRSLNLNPTLAVRIEAVNLGVGASDRELQVQYTAKTKSAIGPNPTLTLVANSAEASGSRVSPCLEVPSSPDSGLATLDGNSPPVSTVVSPGPFGSGSRSRVEGTSVLSASSGEDASRVLRSIRPTGAPGMSLRGSMRFYTVITTTRERLHFGKTLHLAREWKRSGP